MRSLTGLAACGALLLTACKKAPSSQPAGRNQMFVVEVVTIAPQLFRETLFATGTLLANESVTLQSERSGIVKEIRFEEGKPVQAGDVLVVIDDSELQAQMARAKAQLELTAAQEARQRDLLQSKGISEVEYEQSQANLHIAQAEERLIQAQLAKTKVIAPFDGVDARDGVDIFLQRLGDLRLDAVPGVRYASAGRLRLGVQSRARSARALGHR